MGSFTVDHFIKIVFQMKCTGTACPKAFMYIPGHIGTFKQVQSDDPVLIADTEYLEVAVIAVQQHTFLII